jgi:hypothetical protein
VGRGARPGALIAAGAGLVWLALGTGVAAAQAGTGGASSRRTPAFQFSPEAGRALRSLWTASVAAKEERVACLGATVRNDTVFVSRILPLSPAGADSMSIGSEVSIARCGPPEWSGTVHTHVAGYTGDQPSSRFSAQDRGVMLRWYERWHTDGVFCVAYSARDAHCEADGVVGGMRSRPVLVR